MAGLFDMIAGNQPATIDPSAMANMSTQLDQYNPQMVPPQQNNNPQSMVPNHSLTGILGIHGVPGQLLNWLGDTISTAAGFQLPFKDDPAKRAQAAAMQGFTDNPLAAVQRLSATGDTAGATGLYNDVVQQQHNKALLDMQSQQHQDEHAAALQKEGDIVRSQAGKVISAATPETYEGLYGQTQKVFGTKADLAPLGLFDPGDIGKYTVKDPKTGKLSWNDQAESILRQANAFNIPEYKYVGTDAAQLGSNARAIQAGVAQQLAPSAIARNYGIAAAAPANAAAHAQQAQTGHDINYDANGQPILVTDPGRHPSSKGNGRRPVPGSSPAPGQPSSQPVTGQSAPPFPANQFTGKSKWDSAGHEWFSNGQTWIRRN
jgi:hypothetical protein